MRTLRPGTSWYLASCIAPDLEAAAAAEEEADAQHVERVISKHLNADGLLSAWSVSQMPVPPITFKPAGNSGGGGAVPGSQPCRADAAGADSAPDRQGNSGGGGAVPGSQPCRADAAGADSAPDRQASAWEAATPAEGNSGGGGAVPGSRPCGADAAGADSAPDRQASAWEAATPAEGNSGGGGAVPDAAGADSAPDRQGNSGGGGAVPGSRPCGADAAGADSAPDRQASAWEAATPAEGNSGGGGAVPDAAGADSAPDRQARLAVCSGRSFMYGLTAVLPVTVYKRVCSCGGELPFDGAEHGVLNLNNRDLFAHQALRQYCFLLATSGLTFHGFWQSRVASYADLGACEDVDYLMGKRLEFREAWVNYVILQGIDYASVFACKCATPHDAVLVDGIVLGPRKSQVRQHVPWVRPLRTDPVSGSLHSRRVLIPNAVLRTQLRRFFDPGAAKVPGLSRDEFRALKSAAVISRSEANCLHPYLGHHATIQDGRLATSLRPELRRLIASLLSESPVCSILPAHLVSVVDSLANGGALTKANSDLLGLPGSPAPQEQAAEAEAEEEAEAAVGREPGASRKGAKEEAKVASGGDARAARLMSGQAAGAGAGSGGAMSSGKAAAELPGSPAPQEQAAEAEAEEEEEEEAEAAVGREPGASRKGAKEEAKVASGGDARATRRKKGQAAGAGAGSGDGISSGEAAAKEAKVASGGDARAARRMSGQAAGAGAGSGGAMSSGKAAAELPGSPAPQEQAAEAEEEEEEAEAAVGREPGASRKGAKEEAKVASGGDARATRRKKGQAAGAGAGSGDGISSGEAAAKEAKVASGGDARAARRMRGQAAGVGGGGGGAMSSGKAAAEASPRPPSEDSEGDDVPIASLGKRPRPEDDMDKPGEGGEAAGDKGTEPIKRTPLTHGVEAKRRRRMADIYDNEGPALLLPDSNKCLVCNSAASRHQLLVCDDCGMCMHTFCGGMLPLIPPGKFFCGKCAVGQGAQPPVPITLRPDLALVDEGRLFPDHATVHSRVLQTGPPNARLVRIVDGRSFTFNLSREKLQTLAKADTMLHSSIIDGFVEYLRERNDLLRGKVLFLSVGLYNKIHLDKGGTDFAEATKWFEPKGLKYAGVEARAFLDWDCIAVPIHLPDNWEPGQKELPEVFTGHYIWANTMPAERQIVVLDPYPWKSKGVNKEVGDHLLELVEFESRKMGRAFQKEEWEVVEPVTLAKQREGSQDCGVFAMLYGYCTGLGAPMPQVGSDIDVMELRKSFLHMLMTKAVDWPTSRGRRERRMGSSGQRGITGVPKVKRGAVEGGVGGEAGEEGKAPSKRRKGAESAETKEKSKEKGAGKKKSKKEKKEKKQKEEGKEGMKKKEE
ncbi:hypothetical protein HYH03_003505 [Edaphochlamys debaryana]|uniref:Ubiquitin-like protease family profile domain-containing protein n=1 Tax=Edaphochlamys debaryana TaxID=47281 RepID=A0A835YA11_9CHLO|nr:hypothetical protein HYH03_003505 [Edaphochlamys debaryana]|eukprot:KAG2498766.1 hypothetical protein HYH03_003505 [Edaphochlamys debaryana]